MEININRTFNEKLEGLISTINIKGEYLKNHLIIFDIEKSENRKTFLEVIKSQNWTKYDNENNDYIEDIDYVYFYGAHFDKFRLYETFQKFNGKTIIFDNEVILKKQALINILEGAICSSPDSCSKWPIRLQGQDEFIFKGSVILLTDQDKDKFCKTKKYEYLTRDMLKL